MKKQRFFHDLENLIGTSENSKLRVLHLPRPAPRIFITMQAFQKMKCFESLVPHEINGFGVVEQIENNFLIVDTFILKQEALDSTFVETDPKAFNTFIYEMIKKYQDPSKICLQWHSHVDGEVFFSSEDIDTITGYMTDFMISLVINKHGQYKCRLDLFKPLFLSIEVPMYIVLPKLNESIIEGCRKDVAELVTARKSLYGMMNSLLMSKEEGAAEVAEAEGIIDNVCLEAENVVNMNSAGNINLNSELVQFEADEDKNEKRE